MSLKIDMWKIYEDEVLATYVFGSWGLFRNKYIGKAVIFKDSGDVNLVECMDKSIDKEKFIDFYLSRVKMVLNHHRGNGIYPDKTDSPSMHSG